MSRPRPASGARSDRSCKWVAVVLGCLILGSFMAGVILYLPAEQRAQKLEQMRLRYEAKVLNRAPRTAAMPAPGIVAGRTRSN